MSNGGGQSKDRRLLRCSCTPRGSASTVRRFTPIRPVRCARPRPLRRSADGFHHKSAGLSRGQAMALIAPRPTDACWNRTSNPGSALVGRRPSGSLPRQASPRGCGGVPWAAQSGTSASKAVFTRTRRRPDLRHPALPRLAVATSTVRPLHGLKPSVHPRRSARRL
jgi:hypothetical protein